VKPRTEVYEDVQVAIARETRLKKCKRQWTINLIQSHNELWDDETLNA
jgi:predicted GIY-YIG superfamily endonuclease